MIPEYSSHELFFDEKYLTALLEYDSEYFKKYFFEK